MTVIAINLEPALVDVVSSVTADDSLAVDVRSPEELTQLDAGTIDAVVLGSAGETAQWVRRCQTAWPRVPVVVVAAERECKALHDAMRFSVYGSRDVHCIPNEQRDRLRDRIRSALDEHRRRVGVERTIHALNRRLGEAAPATRTASVLLGRLLAVAPVGVVITDADARVREVNARALRLLANDDRGLVETHVWEPFLSDDQQAVRALLAECNGDPNGQRTLLARRPADVHLELTATKLGSDAGGPGYLVVVQDVSERQRLVGELQTANRAKDEFIAMLGHELRNPLAPVLTAVELLRSRPQLGIERECATIARHVHHMAQLIDDLLDISRITQGKLELRRRRVELASTITHAIEMVSPLLEQHAHRLEVDVPATGLAVDGDPMRLAQIFANLLSNAAKYTDRGGTITVTGARVGDRVEVRVRDTGRGIAPDILPRIFDLFVQERQAIDRSRGGLGLGLAIVRSLVQLHDGDVSVVSQPGTGSEFTVRLPLAVAPEAAQPPRTAPVAGQQLRILVVDDNADGAELMSEVLTTLGYTTEIAFDGPGAIAAATRFLPDIVLLDIGLPVMDGYEVAAQMRADPRFARTKLVAVTGYGQDHDRARSLASGFAEHLTKPITIPVLQAALARVRAER